jgi:tetraacyldisaccharide 4'-kinase
MRAPAFWWRQQAGPAAFLLAPLGAAYGAVTSRRMAAAGAKVDVPVVCVGNFVAGGAGKTPAAIAIAELLIAQGERPVFLSRGYGRRGTRDMPPLRVDPATHTSADVGDEPLLLARIAPTIVCARRVDGARAARVAGASVIVMDDGLQNPSLHKDLALAVVDGASGIGNGLSIPAGPLRAPLGAQLDHVDALVVIGPGAAGEAVGRTAARRGKPIFSAQLVADPAAKDNLVGRRVVAFAGIGRPGKFFETLTEIGARVVARRAFADHHVYAARDLAELERLAREEDALLITTEKDAVRIPRDKRGSLTTLPVSVVFESPQAVSALVAGVLVKTR